MADFKARERKNKPKTGRRPGMSYYQPAPPSSKSPFKRGARPKKRRWLSRAAEWTIFTAILIVIGYSMMLRPDPEVRLNFEKYRAAEIYREASVSTLNELKNRNKLTFDEDGLAVALKRKFPEISHVSVSMPLIGQRPTINIAIAEPRLILRGPEGVIGPNESLVIDSKGTVVGPQRDFPEIKDLPLITDAADLGISKGHSILSTTDVNFIMAVIAQAKKANVPVVALALPKQAREVYLHSSDRTYYVKFSLGGDALTQAGQFLAAREHFDKTNKQPAEYLDVRVSGKIYYK